MPMCRGSRTAQYDAVGASWGRPLINKNVRKSNVGDSKDIQGRIEAALALKPGEGESS
ncbi:uncharacterized protein G2W53_034817 [Senna tora]|uniref:Uncharacterized protein n=1 Tax=Senna tora TaxID=362788 RepID=A0A834T3Y8_9FABA|nr:uncharacterized protein G2W53_034817 [Senna tora]